MSVCNPSVARLNPEEDFPKVQTFLEELIQRTKIPGISVAMNVNGVALEAAAGISDAQTSHPMTPDMHFELGCLNKFLTALIVLELVSKEKINLDQVISHYLPELSGKNGDIIKIRHLLSHTAGYQGENMADPDIQMDYSYEEFVQTFNQLPMHFEPGTVFDYSHSASMILGKITEKVSGHQTRELVKELIFKPLGITPLKGKHSGSAQCICGHHLNLETTQLIVPLTINWCELWQDSLGGAWITMRDLAKLGKAILDGKTISETTKTLLQCHEVKLPSMFVGAKTEQPFFVFSLGHARFPNGSYGMRSTSIGQCCAFRLDLARGMVIAVGVNAEAPYLRDFCINKLSDAMLPEDSPVLPELLPETETVLEPELVSGTYTGKKESVFNITYRDGNLTLSMENNPSIQSRNLFVNIEVEEVADGKIRVTNTPESISVGFFRDTERGCLHAMMNYHTYKGEL